MSQEEMTKTGINVVGNVSWGTHLCQFYQTKKDLLDILLPYFKAGLENNEFCLWITSEPLNQKEAKEAIGKAIPQLDRYLARGQIEIIPYSEWYPKDGSFNAGRILADWVDKLNEGLKMGFEGLRLTGNTFWLEKKHWKEFADYEEQINAVIGKHRMIAICTYSLDRCGAFELMDVVNNHQFALIRREGSWELMESSERKKAEKELKVSEKRYELLFENSGCPITYFDTQGKYVFLNRQAIKNLGKKAKNIIGKSVHDIFPESADFYLQRFAKIVKKGKGAVFEDWVELPGGTRCFSSNIQPVKDKNGKVVGVQVISSDITERKKAEEELTKETTFVKAIVDCVPGTVFVFDENMKRILWTRRDKEVAGWTAEELQRMKPLDLFAEEDRPRIANKIQEAFSKGTANTEVNVLTKGGARAHYYLSVAAPLVGDTRHIIAIGLDITERKKAEKEREEMQIQLFRAQKMEAIGVLVAGVAHDFNNLLMAIQGNVDLLLGKLDETDSLCSNLKDIQHASKHGADLIRQLLLFSRKQPMEFRPLNINKTVNNLLKMMKRLIGEDITIETHLEPELWIVEADAANIEQMLVNLVINARDAMPEGGMLTIKTENVTLKKDECKVIPEAKHGKFICLSVQDTGVGMDEGTVERVFEPFFTTKKNGKGTGLGLSVAYGIVKKHKGWINIETRPGEGSTFKTYLPASSKELEDESKERISLAELQGSGERVLVVEDQEGVREFLSRALSENGYLATEVKDAKEARDIFEEEKGNFDLIFCDVVLPDKSGLQLVSQLLSSKPGIPVLLSSGYVDEKSQRSLIHKRGFRFLQKPYSLVNLLQTIKETLQPE